MITTQDQDAVEKEVGADVVAQEPVVQEPATKAKKAEKVEKALDTEKVETIERPGSNLKLKAAIGYLALRLLDPSGVADFKNLYPEIFE